MFLSLLSAATRWEREGERERERDRDRDRERGNRKKTVNARCQADGASFLFRTSFCASLPDRLESVLIDCDSGSLVPIRSRHGPPAVQEWQQEMSITLRKWLPQLVDSIPQSLWLACCATTQLFSPEGCWHTCVLYKTGRQSREWIVAFFYRRLAGRGVLCIKKMSPFWSVV